MQRNPMRPVQKTLKWRLRVVSWLATSLAAATAALFAQTGEQQPTTTPFEEEDLAPDALYEERSSSTFRLFQEAEALFRSADQPEALPLLEQVIEEIERRIEQGLAEDAEREILLQALFYRTEAHFNLGNEQATEESLTELLTFRPDFRPDPTSISPKLLQRFEEARGRLIGELTPAVTPPDAVLSVDGREIGASDGVVPVLAGVLRVRISRPGFESRDVTIEITAGSETPLAADLQRVSAVASIFTRPAGAEVLLDGEPVGITAERKEAAESDDEAAAFATLRVDGLSLGQHILEVRKGGYRPRRFELSIAELGDYAFEPIVLEPMAGTLILTSVPGGARVLVGGRLERAVESQGPIRISLPPGDHRVTVHRGQAGWFEEDLVLADRQTIELAVRLTPGLSFLGVLGGDDLTGRDLQLKLAELLATLDNWTFLDRSAEGVTTVIQAGLDTGRLRRLAADGLLPEDLAPWAVLQREADLALSGSAYLVAVLTDDLLAKDADLWFLPAAPGPALPVRRRLELETPDALRELLSYFEPSLAFQRATLGVEVIDSQAAEHPVIAFVAAGGPAAASGLGVGELVVAIDGEELAGAADLAKQLATRQPGSRVQLQVDRGGSVRVLEARLGMTPSVVSPSDPRLLYPLAWAALDSRVATATSEIPPWLVGLNEAAVLLRGGAWAEAIRTLRGIEAPARQGVGQAAVDYWLGVALLAADPAAYLDAARQAFSRALESPEARLHDDLGAMIAPRARGRLANISTP